MTRLVQPGTVSLHFGAGDEDTQASVDVTRSSIPGHHTVTVYAWEHSEESRRVTATLRGNGAALAPSYSTDRNLHFEVLSASLVEAVAGVYPLIAPLNPVQIRYWYWQQPWGDDDAYDNVFITPVVMADGQLHPSEVHFAHDWFTRRRGDDTRIPQITERILATGLCEEAEWVPGEASTSYFRVVLKEAAQTDLPTTYLELADVFPLRDGRF